MFPKYFIVLTLLSGLGFASVVRPRGVSCSFSTAANPGDTCESFSKTWGTTVDTFKSLNPGVNCPNLVAGQTYCAVGTVTTDAPTSSTAPMTTSKSAIPPTTSTQTTTVATPSGPPSPTQPGIAKDCDKFHLVSSGDTCITIETRYGISASQFMMWNPFINAACSNLWLDYYVCVHTPGATTVVPSPTPTPTGPQPQMPGIVENCKKFYLVKSGDSCYTIGMATGVSLSQLRMWNKNISPSCDNLWLGYYICVGV
ncbi:hypothetical protein PRK78_004469 [Emydomyces testavorans]|uniref:LysM domain-containing protein n=1 Tax=Emydomyces testavorans TaxID=2070801 RepID=A0AAF0DKA0_9EURO|nr:hypothetical protein PRK78_004469 [Emydomyces testavorans]